MIAWAPLVAADIEPYLKLIGLIVAVSIMAINHLLAGLKRARAQLPPPPPDGTPAPDPVASASMRQDLNAEVKEFLRRAAQQRSGQQRNEQQRGGPQAPTRQPSPVTSPSGRRSDEPRKQKRKSQQPVAPDVPKLDDSLANRRMTSRLETTTLDDRAEQLSSLDKQDATDARVQQSLDHQMGKLTSGFASSATTAPSTDAASETADSAGNSAAHIAALLRDPRSIRTAMILNEILARPTDRW